MHTAARLQVAVYPHVLSDEIEADHSDSDRDQQARVKGAHDPLRVEDPDEERANDRADHAHRAKQQRVDHPADLVLEEQRAQQHRRDHRHGVGLEEVRGHARAVADVVADVVSDHRGVAWIVFGNAGLYLAHQVSPHVGRLGVDATAKPGEHRHEAGAESQANHCVGVLEDEVGARHAEQTKPDDHEAGDGPAAERHLQRLIQPSACGLSRA